MTPKVADASVDCNLGPVLLPQNNSEFVDSFQFFLNVSAQQNVYDAK